MVTSLVCDVQDDFNQETGGIGQYRRTWRSVAFYLPYEIGFVKNFTVDSENHPRGCNFPEAQYPDPIWKEQLKVKLQAGEEETSADIVDKFADDHEVWAHAFIQGWQVLCV